MIDAPPRAWPLPGGVPAAGAQLALLDADGGAPPGRAPGLPRLYLRPDLIGTEDGLAKYPYVRRAGGSGPSTPSPSSTWAPAAVKARARAPGEGRALQGQRGLGCYRIDLHPSAGATTTSTSTPCPSASPSGALLPAGAEPPPGGKNLGVTHITNGCYRLHPVEWNIGEAAGLLASLPGGRAGAPPGAGGRGPAARLPGPLPTPGVRAGVAPHPRRLKPSARAGHPPPSHPPCPGRDAHPAAPRGRAGPSSTLTTRAGHRHPRPRLAPGRRPGAPPGRRGQVRPPTPAPVEWLLEDMAEYDIPHCVLVQSSAFGWDNTYMVECLERYPRRFKAIGLVDPLARRTPATYGSGWRGDCPASACTPSLPGRALLARRPRERRPVGGGARAGAIMQFLWPRHAPALARMIERHPQVRVIVDHLGKPDAARPPRTRLRAGAASGRFPADLGQDRGLPDRFTRTRTPGGTPGPSWSCCASGSAPAGCCGAPATPAPPGAPGAGPALRAEDLPFSDGERRQILWQTPALFGFA